jgi:hypothetical protein
MPTNKNCSNCKHQQMIHGSNSVCNLYNKYAVAARIQCNMECWEKKPKEKVKVVGDKLIVK